MSKHSHRIKPAAKTKEKPRRKLTKLERVAISNKIREFRHEGIKQAQAVAKAISMVTRRR